VCIADLAKEEEEMARCSITEEQKKQESSREESQKTQ
jgi:hypothetical protein